MTWSTPSRQQEPRSSAWATPISTSWTRKPWQRASRQPHLTLVVNTTAFHHLDRCEEEPATAYAVNATGARNVAAAAEAAGAALIHISTDYVFDGRKASPYAEATCPGP